MVIICLFDGYLSTSYRQVVIIGAGISGLAAAKTLIDNDITNIVILEAQDYPGGRVKSIKHQDYYHEMGAQWLHGEDNEYFQYCESNNLLSDVCSAEGVGIYIREDGTLVDESLVEEVKTFIDDVLCRCERYSTDKWANPLSVGQELLTAFEEFIEQYDEDVRCIVRELYEWHIKFLLIDNGCYDLYKLSAKAWGDYKSCKGRDYVNFTHGFSSSIDSLVSCLPQGVLQLNSPVSHVDWSQPDLCDGFSNFDISDTGNKQSHVKIKTEDKIYLANCVVVTCSIGYLKQNYLDLFWPPLPLEAVRVINKLGFGPIGKIFLIYDNRWWSQEVPGFQFVWSKNKSEGKLKEWTRDLTGFDVVVNQKNVLVGWIGGYGCEVMEKLDEGDIAQDVTEVFKQFLRRSDIPLPCQVFRSQWCVNPYVNGGYSHTTTLCDELHIRGEHLLNPICHTVGKSKGTANQKPVLLFAGEATHPTHFSTTHGAYDTGVKQANVIINHQRSSLVQPNTSHS